MAPSTTCFTLAFDWDFGDGATASGRAASHIYLDAGTYQVRLTASDGVESGFATNVVTVRDLTAKWTGTLTTESGLSFGTQLNLRQSGASISGSYLDFIDLGSVSGSVSPPDAVTLSITVAGYFPVTFTGTADERVTH